MVPDDSAGAVTVMEVAELTTSPVPVTVPNLTVLAPVKLEPLIVTDVPPGAGPELGETPVTTGNVEEPIDALNSSATPDDMPAGFCLAVGATFPVTFVS